MLMAYLLSTHKVGKTMNAYQLFRNALHFLGKKDHSKTAFYNLLLWWLWECINQFNHLLDSFTFSASTDLTESGITLARNPDSKAVSRSDSCIYCFLNPFCLCCITMPFSFFLLQPSLQDFQAAFSVVFVDPSGHLNLLADMTAFTYKQVSSDVVSI